MHHIHKLNMVGHEHGFIQIPSMQHTEGDYVSIKCTL